jgi:uncharacterized protein (TIGR02996 family)
MSDNPALLRAVLAAPDDDLPRLVYADWYEEHGEPERAEFIRTQIELAHSPDAGLQAREQELLDTHGWAWAEPLGKQVHAWEFRRGFVEAVELSLERPAAEFLPVFDLAPIRHLRDNGQFCDLSGVIDALPHFDRLTGLEFWGLYAFDDELIRRMLASPHLANLRTLILFHDRNGNTVPDHILADGLRSRHRRKLERLAVNVDGSWRGPTREVLAAMADSPHLRNLRAVDLSCAGDGGNHPQMDVATAQAIGASRNFAKLRELNLVHASFNLKTWDEVLKWPFLKGLEKLYLNYARQVRPPSYLTVAQIANLPKYRTAFDELVPHIDWGTRFVSPDIGLRPWQSWGGLQRRHALAMWPFVKDGRYDALVKAYRKDCVKFAGRAAAAAIDALPFDKYAERVRRALKRAVAAAESDPEAASIVCTDWGSSVTVYVTNEPVAEPFEPGGGGSVSGMVAEFAAGALDGAEEVKRKYHSTNPLDPGAVRHYLFARVVAAIGRVAKAAKAALPVIVSGECAFKLG